MHNPSFVWTCLLEHDNLATFKVISGRVLFCDSAQSWQLYNGAPLADTATSTINCFPKQSYYPDSELTISCSILIMLSTHLGRESNNFVSH